jgi:hypothetical protein
MKTFLRLFRSARNRRRHSRIPLLGEYMKRLNEIGEVEGKILWERVDVSRPTLAPCFVRFARIN